MSKSFTGKWWVGAYPPAGGDLPTQPDAVSTDLALNYGDYFLYNAEPAIPYSRFQQLSPVAGDSLSAVPFYARFTGTFVVPISGTYIIGASNDDATSVYVNGTAVYSQLGQPATGQGNLTYNAGCYGNVALVAGAVNTLVLEWAQIIAGTYVLQLLITSPAGVTSLLNAGDSLPTQIVKDRDLSNTFKLVVYDANKHIVIVPQDVLSFSFEDVVNGGSGQGSFKLKRNFVDQGWCNYQYRVQLYLNGSTYPWYDGRMIEIDPRQAQGDDESITIQTEGWSTQMANAIVSEVLTPSATAGTMNADVYLTHLLGTYLDNSLFGASYVAAIPLALDGLTFDGQELNTCIDAVVKQITDVSGQIYEWWVRGPSGGGLPAIVIQPQQNPNLVSGVSFFAPGGTTATHCIMEFKDSSIYDYEIQNSSRSIYNMIALYGGTLNGVQVYNAFKDSTSMSLYGTRQKKVTNTVLLSTTTLAQYGATWLACNAYPQPAGSFKKYEVNDLARAGQWFQVMEDGANSYDGYRFIDFSTNDLTPGTTQGVKQVRSIRVITSMQEGTNRLEQQVFTLAPRPFIDHAFYGAINYAAGRTAAAQGFAGPTQLTNYFLLNVTAAKPGPPATVKGASITNLIADSNLIQSSVYTAAGRAITPYNLKWSFALIDNISFWIALVGGIGQMNINFRGFTGFNAQALSSPFTLNPGTYTFAFSSNAGFTGTRWSIVLDKGGGSWPSQYSGASALFNLNVPTGTGVTTGTYIYSGAAAKGRILFESLGYTLAMSTWSPTLAYAP